jgi:hypothetical protein
MWPEDVLLNGPPIFPHLGAPIAAQDDIRDQPRMVVGIIMDIHGGIADFLYPKQSAFDFIQLDGEAAYLHFAIFAAQKIPADHPLRQRPKSPER